MIIFSDDIEFNGRELLKLELAHHLFALLWTVKGCTSFIHIQTPTA